MNDREIVTKAGEQDGSSLQTVSNEIQKDIESAIDAIKEYSCDSN